MTRSHYPMHPLALELADRYGIVVWSEVPVYQMRDQLFRRAAVRRRAVQAVRDMVNRDRSHPSVIVWSLGNENTSKPGSGFTRYVREATRLVRRLDRTRLVGLAFPGYPTIGKEELYTRLDALGVNDYFGWYPGPQDSIVDRSALSPYLERLHDDYRRQALFVTEFGAEANRPGLPTEKGTFDFQNDFLSYHLGVFRTKGLPQWGPGLDLARFPGQARVRRRQPRAGSPVQHKGTDRRGRRAQAGVRHGEAAFPWSAIATLSGVATPSPAQARLRRARRPQPEPRPCVPAMSRANAAPDSREMKHITQTNHSNSSRLFAIGMCIATCLVGVLALASPAAASKTQWSMFEDHVFLVRSGPAVREQTLDEIRGSRRRHAADRGEVERGGPQPRLQDRARLRRHRPGRISGLRALRRPRARGRSRRASA